MKSEKETAILYINTHTYIYMEFRKTVTMTLHARQQETQILLDSVGEGKGGMI